MPPLSSQASKPPPICGRGMEWGPHGQGLGPIAVNHCFRIYRGNDPPVDQEGEEENA